MHAETSAGVNKESSSHGSLTFLRI